MTFDPNFSIRLQLNTTDPTGDPCDRCGEIYYLRAFLIVIVVGSSETLLGYYCEGCKDVARERFRGMFLDD